MINGVAVVMAIVRATVENAQLFFLKLLG